MKEKINDIIYDALNGCLNDLEDSVDINEEEIKIREETLLWFYDVLKDKISDYFDFECEECEEND